MTNKQILDTFPKIKESVNNEIFNLIIYAMLKARIDQIEPTSIMKTENTNEEYFNEDYYLDKEQRALDSLKIVLFILMLGILVFSFTTWTVVLAMLKTFNISG